MRKKLEVKFGLGHFCCKQFFRTDLIFPFVVVVIVVAVVVVVVVIVVISLTGSDETIRKLQSCPEAAT